MGYLVVGIIAAAVMKTSLARGAAAGRLS